MCYSGPGKQEKQVAKNTMKKTRGETRGAWGCDFFWGGVAILCKLVREAISEKVMFEQRPQRGGGEPSKQLARAALGGQAAGVGAPSEDLPGELEKHLRVQRGCG